MTTRFEGFGEHAVDFYDGLAADNSKSYWTDNKATYLTDVRAPMEALLAELTAEFATDFGSATVFRPYRDVRFAKDKTPYKTHCGGVIEPGRGAGAYYVELGPEGVRTGGGCFHLHADQLARFRTAVAEEIHGEALGKILTKLEKAGWEIKGDRLATKPRGYPADHPRLDLLRYRSVYAARTWPPDDVLHERVLLDRVRKAWRAVRAFNEWARDHVGITEQPRR
ncbi:MAG: TIGR02453 family protein [Actinophytocola sp.]|nr:TIGR02453 family protein [Actinophytocola sp.]